MIYFVLLQTFTAKYLERCLWESIDSHIREIRESLISEQIKKCSEDPISAIAPDMAQLFGSLRAVGAFQFWEEFTPKTVKAEKLGGSTPQNRWKAAPAPAIPLARGVPDYSPKTLGHSDCLLSYRPPSRLGYDLDTDRKKKLPGTGRRAKGESLFAPVKRVTGQGHGVPEVLRWEEKPVITPPPTHPEYGYYTANLRRPKPPERIWERTKAGSSRYGFPIPEDPQPIPQWKGDAMAFAAMVDSHQ